MKPTFSDEAAERYRRHFALAGFGPDRQARLQAATVLVIGAGGLGCPALFYLAAAGVGRIVLLDSDRVEVSNLQRQVLFGTEDVGKDKAIPWCAWKPTSSDSCGRTRGNSCGRLMWSWTDRTILRRDTW